MSRNSSPSHSLRESANNFHHSNNNNNSFRPRPSGVPSSSGGGPATNPAVSRLNPSSRGPSPGFQNPSTHNNPSNSSTRNIGLLLGCPIKLKLVTPGPNSNDRWVEGQVWCYDPLSGVIVLECPGSEGVGKGKMTYRMVKMNQVKEIQIGEKVKVPSEMMTTSEIVGKVLEPLKPIDITGVAMRECAAVKSDEIRCARTGYGVSRWAQEIFDALGKTLPVRWAQTSIVILDDVLLPGPLYRPEDAKTNHNQSGLARVRQVLEGEVARLLKTEEGRSMESEARLAANKSQAT